MDRNTHRSKYGCRINICAQTRRTIFHIVSAHSMCWFLSPPSRHLSAHQANEDCQQLSLHGRKPNATEDCGGEPTKNEWSGGDGESKHMNIPPIWTWHDIYLINTYGFWTPHIIILYAYRVNDRSCSKALPPSLKRWLRKKMALNFFSQKRNMSRNGSRSILFSSR